MLVIGIASIGALIISHRERVVTKFEQEAYQVAIVSTSVVWTAYAYVPATQTLC